MSSYCLVGGHRVLVGGPELCSGVGIWLWESLKYRHEVVTDHKQWEPLKYRHEVIKFFFNPPPPPHLTILWSPFFLPTLFSLPSPPIFLSPISFHHFMANLSTPTSPTILPPLHLSYHFPPPPPPPTSLLPFYSRWGGGGGGSKISI